MSTLLLEGTPIADAITEDIHERVRTLEGRGTGPTLGTVLMSDDPADRRFMDLKHEACADVGIDTRDRRLEPDAPAARLYRTIDDLASAAAVDALFVQVPLPDHVDSAAVRNRLDPTKDVDCFHPENLGRLVAGEPRFVPATPAAVRAILTRYGVTVPGKDVVIVGRSNAIGKPLANLLLRDAEYGNATVTVCHSRTDDLGAKTRRADIVITASGTPELVDGSMLSEGVAVVDVSANRVASDDDGAETTVVGDVEFESAREKADAITPVPGGVGPVTLAMLLENVVTAAERRSASGG